MTIEVILQQAGTADWILNLAAGSLLLLLVGCLVRRLSRNRPAPERSAAGLTILLLLLALPLLLLVITPNKRSLLPELSRTHTPIRTITAPKDGHISSRLSKASGRHPLSKTASSPSLSAQPGRNARTALRGVLIRLVNLFGLTAAIGFLIGVIRLCIGLWQTARFRRKLEPCSDARLRKEMIDLRRSSGRMKFPAILTSPIITAPLTLGVLRPAIVLPQSLASVLSANELRGVLLHEAAHVRHRDPLIGLLQRLLKAFYWWNPLIYHASSAFSRDREIVCDNYAIQDCGPAVYARCLADLAWKSHRRPILAQAANLAGISFPLERRIRGIMARDRSLLTSISRRGIVCLALAAGMLLIPTTGFRLTLAAETHDTTLIALPRGSRPTSIRVDEGRVYVTADTTIHAFGTDGRHLNRFGRKGEGPNEFSYQPHLTPLKDSLWVNDFNKILVFSKDGEVRRRIDLPFANFYMYYPLLPVGAGYVGFPWKKHPESGRLIHTGTIFDCELKSVRTFYEGMSPSLLPPPKDPTKRRRQTLEAVYDCLDWTVYDDRIYVADSRKGFYIAVFDSSGEKLYEIRHPHHPQPVPSSFKRKFNDLIEHAPNRMEIRRWFDYTWRETLPAFFSFTAVDGRLFIITYASQNGRFELVEMDLSGRILKRSFIFPIHPLERVTTGIEPFSNEYAIRSGKLYHLIKHNPESEYQLEIIDIE